MLNSKRVNYLYLKIFLLVAISCIGIFILWVAGPIPQDLSYHDFADKKQILTIPNFFDVISNIIFIIIGFWGILVVLKNKSLCISNSEFYIWIIFFISISLVGIGSGFYHLSPDNMRLIWDRIPMVISFMSLLSIITSERVSQKLGYFCFIPLVLLGIGSVIYWGISEANGAGDLRPYIFVQFVTLLLIIVCTCFKSNYNSKWIYIAFIFYAAAKGCEHYDLEIYNYTRNIISGHTIKHLLSGLAIGWLVLHYRCRKIITDRS